MQNKWLKKILFSIAILPLFLIGITLGYLHLIQEKRIFDFKPLDQNHLFQFDVPFEEVSLKTEDSTVTGLFFKAENPQGAIYYLHGKGSNLSHPKWNRIASYLVKNLNQDVFMIDYRGFGKSEGPIHYEGLLQDAESGYAYLKSRYPEDSITVYGLSLGSSFATYIASKNQPKQLILEAPFYSLEDVACSTLPMVPKFMLQSVIRYPLRTDLWIQSVKCPIYLFHGTNDSIIPYNSSIRLKELAQAPCELTIIENGDHNHLNLTPEYQEKLTSSIEFCQVAKETTLSSDALE